MGYTSNGQSRKDSSFSRLAFSGEAGLLLLAWALARLLHLSPLNQVRPSLPALAWGIAATLPLLVGLVWILTTRSGPARRLVTFVVNQLGPLLADCPALELALLAGMAGVSEEVLFRGVIQVGLARVLPEGLALIVASALFGLIHFATREYAALAGVMGLYLGALFLAQGSLLAPIVTHALYDFVALLYVARNYRASRG
jgi:CAAX protease family protein